MAARKSSTGTKKHTAQAAVPKASAVGRAPIEWAHVMVDKPGAEGANGIFLFEAGVYPSQKKEVEKSWIGPEAQKEEAPAENGDSAPDEPAAPKNGKKKADTKPEAEGEMFLHVHEGKKAESFPLSAEQLASYRTFEGRFKDARGIHLRCVVPGAALAGFAHKNVYYLSPRAEVGESLKAYHALHSLLFASYHAIVGHYVHGKGGGFDPVGIMAVERGLVMWQLPPLGASHPIEDAIDSSQWQNASLTPQERGLFGRLVEKLSRDRLEPEDLRDPRRLLLDRLIHQKRAAGEAPRSTSGKDFPNLLTALQALVGEEHA